MAAVNLTNNFFLHARGLTIADSGSAVWAFDKSTNTLTLAAGGGATGFANPTAKVGTAAVNGVATTAMRSDAAPALSLTISPTWTGNHTFAPSGGGAALTCTALAATNTASLSFGGSTTGAHFVAFSNTGGLLWVGLESSTGAVLATGTPAYSAAIITENATALVLGTNGAARLTIASTGGGTWAAPVSGDTLALTNVAGANALSVNGNAAGTAVLRLNTQATTGAQTATFTATNKPGSGTTSPNKWIPINLDGTTHYVPAFL
jgi:hypothetical protein